MVQTEEGLCPASSEPTSGCLAKLNFEHNNNDMRVLLSMAIGLTLDDGSNKVLGEYSEDERFPKTQKKKWNPRAGSELFDEIKRRKSILGITTKTNRQIQRPIAIQWLIEHPLTDSVEVDFVTSKVTIFLDNVRSSEAENADKHEKRDQWSGILPFLRLIHCLVDFDDIRAAFQTSFTTLTRQELDGRYNEETMRVDVWPMVADKWNDKEYNPTSCLMPNLHDEFRAEIDLSHQTIHNMGECTPDKAKAKFFSMKNDLIPVKNNWEKSGNGDGSKLVRDNSDESVDSEEEELMNANDKRNFLNGKSPAILYLWALADENNLLDSVCQQIDESIGRDSASDSGNNSLTGRKKRKLNGNNDDEDADLLALRKTMNATNSSLEKSDAMRERQELRKLVSDYEDKILGVEDRLDNTNSEERVHRLEAKLAEFEENLRSLKEKLGAIEEKIAGEE